MKVMMASPEPAIDRVSPLEVERAKEVLILDVRTPAEFEEAHIEGSVLHPLSSLEPGEVARLAAGKEESILICRSGNRARQAAEKLRASGLKSVKVLDGGMQAWEAAGLPLKRGRGTISLERQVRIAAGILVLTGALLGYFVHPAWITLSGLVGAGLVFAGVTDTCGMGMLLARMPWNHRAAAATDPRR
jgi:rhodanese-related sulfurtransferase